ncbi:TPA: DNA repair protein RadC, partial [Klebsiella pneumoniae]|nr:DNA repair protein RadC [Klebsiella pneumoniae]
NPVPSAADKALTLRIKAALLLVEVNTHDHMIVTGNTLTSFAESGLL